MSDRPGISAGTLNERIRRIALSRQGLLSAASFGRGLPGAKNAINRLGYVQIDTLSVVERAHHHVLWSRVPGYVPDMLNRLVAKRQIFEYWAHAAAYLPLNSYRFCLPRMHAIRAGESRYYASADPRLMSLILDRVRAEGPLRSRDLEAPGGKASGSWSWGPTRRALDRLVMQGDLIVVARSGIEKTFELAGRWMPAGLDLSMPRPEDHAQHLVDQTLAAHGAVRRDQILYSRPGRAVVDAVDSEIARRIADRELISLCIDERFQYFVAPGDLDQSPPRRASTVKILSPFDNSVIHRDRLSQLFGMNYRLECYVPRPKRRHGYFCLPILYRGSFVGLVDCKADRAAAKLDVLSLHLGSLQAREASFEQGFAAELNAFARFNGCCVVENKSALGPSQWLVPSSSDFGVGSSAFAAGPL